MKTGLILYITGDDQGRKIDKAGVLKQMSVSAERVEIVSQNHGHYDIDDAWWALTVRGMHRIICKTARINNAGEIRWTGQELRLCG